MSLIEKTEFSFFEFPIFRYCLVLAFLQNSVVWSEKVLSYRTFTCAVRKLRLWLELLFCAHDNWNGVFVKLVALNWPRFQLFFWENVHIRAVIPQHERLVMTWKQRNIQFWVRAISHHWSPVKLSFKLPDPNPQLSRGHIAQNTKTAVWPKQTQGPYQQKQQQQTNVDQNENQRHFCTEFLKMTFLFHACSLTVLNCMNRKAISSQMVNCICTTPMDDGVLPFPVVKDVDMDTSRAGE